MSVLDASEMELEFTLDNVIEVPECHSQVSQAFNPVFQASKVLEELLLKYWTNPNDQKNKNIQKVNTLLLELRYMLDFDLENQMKDKFDRSVYHPIQMD
jgi:hypothetical protein